MRKVVAFALLLASCKPVESPKAKNVVIGTINVTDTVLADYINTAPPGELEQLTVYVAALKRASDIVENSGKLCDAVSSVSKVASGIACTKCLQMVNEASEELSCPK